MMLGKGAPKRKPLTELNVQRHCEEVYVDSQNDRSTRKTASRSTRQMRTDILRKRRGLLKLRLIWYLKFWSKMMSIFSLSCLNPLIDLTPDLTIVFLPRNMWNTNLLFSPSIILAASLYRSRYSFHLLVNFDFWFVHRSLSQT